MRKTITFVVSSVLGCSPALAAQHDIFWYIFHGPAKRHYHVRLKHLHRARPNVQYIVTPSRDGKSLDVRELEIIRDNLTDISRKLKDKHDAPTLH